MPETASSLLTVLRHGAVEGTAHVLRGHGDDPLSSTGWEQMEACVARLATPPVSVITTSPLRRCRAFAEALAGRWAVPLEVRTDLAEMDFGAWDGLTPEEAARRDPERFARFYADPAGSTCPAGEAYDAFRARVRGQFETWGNEPTSHRLVITHAGVMRALLGEILDMPPSHGWRIALATGASFRVSLCSGQPPCLLALDGAVQSLFIGS